MKWPSKKSEEEKNIDQLARENRQLQDELRSLERALQDRKRIIILKDAEIAKVVSSKDTEIAKIASLRDAENARAGRQLTQAQEHHRREIQTITVNNDSERQRITAEYAQGMENLKDTHAVEIYEQARIARTREEQLNLQHQQQTKSLHDQVQQLNTALLTRDDDIYQGMIFTASGIPQKPDNKIRDDFMQVQQMVEELGRLKWKQGQTAWPDHLLEKMTTRHAERMVRKVIVQDIAWSLLFYFIFCSPFRTFGDAGQELEREWNEQCGKDDRSREQIYTWPAPGVKSERWRYLTIKECREALTKPLSQFDPRAKLKKGYKSSLDNLIAQLNAQLGYVLELSPADVQLIQRLAKKAILVWLDFGMHRCRIRIYLTGWESRSMADKMALAQSSSLNMTALPLVGRHGNVKGVDLESFTTIDGCAGDSITIP